MKTKNYKSFFKGELLYIVDALSCRYHKLPSEILELPLQEFNLNVAILLKAVERERKQQEEQMKNYKKHGAPVIKGDVISLGGFNITKIKKKKKNAS